MKQEDIDFLKELSHELNTQETDCQAEPRYWAIQEDQRERAADGEGNPIIIVNGCDEIDIETLIDDINDDISEMEKEAPATGEVVREQWGEIDRTSVEDVVEFAKDVLQFDVYIVWTTIERRIAEYSNCFLTKRAAKKHLEQNGHHYHNGRTYAMTALRNYELERLLKILKETDWGTVENALKSAKN